jgi:hypothetical protein
LRCSFRCSSLSPFQVVFFVSVKPIFIKFSRCGGRKKVRLSRARCCVLFPPNLIVKNFLIARRHIKEIKKARKTLLISSRLKTHQLAEINHRSGSRPRRLCAIKAREKVILVGKLLLLREAHSSSCRKHFFPIITRRHESEITFHGTLEAVSSLTSDFSLAKHNKSSANYSFNPSLMAPSSAIISLNTSLLSTSL